MVRATLLLCDFAQVAEGKLYISGGGWSWASRLQGYLAGVLQLPWDYAQRHLKGRALIVDGTGTPVPAIGGEGDVRTEFEMMLAPAVSAARDMPLEAPFALPLPPRELPDGAYSLVFEFDGERRPEWVLPFRIVSRESPELTGQTPHLG